MFKFIWYTLIALSVVAFCILNQQVVALDLYWIRVLAPMHLWIISAFVLGVFIESFRIAVHYILNFFSLKKIYKHKGAL